jgi:hypothetical protein
MSGMPWQQDSAAAAGSASCWQQQQQQQQLVDLTHELECEAAAELECDAAATGTAAVKRSMSGMPWQQEPAAAAGSASCWQQQQQQQLVDLTHELECEAAAELAQYKEREAAATRPAAVEHGMSGMPWQQEPAAAAGHEQQQQQLDRLKHELDMIQQQLLHSVLREPQRREVATTACVDAEALQQALSADVTAIASGDMRAAAAPVAAATESFTETDGSQTSSQNGGMSQDVLDVISQQQQQQMQDEQMPQQARLCGLAAGALSSAGAADCLSQQELDDRKERQQALEQHLALRAPLLPGALQLYPAADTPAVAEPYQQQQEMGGWQQAAAAAERSAVQPAAAAMQPADLFAEVAATLCDDALPVPAAEEAGALMQPSLAGCAGTAAAQDADTSAPTQQVALMRLAETADGRALLDNLRALQLLPVDLPLGAQLTLQLVVQPAASTAEEAVATGGPNVPVAVPAVAAVAPAAAVAVSTAAAAAAVACAKPVSSAGSNCSSRSKDVAVADAAGADATTAGRAAQLSCSGAGPAKFAAPAATAGIAADIAAQGLQQVEEQQQQQQQQQQQHRSVVGAVFQAAPQGASYSVGSKRPLSAVLPAEAMAAAVAAAKRVLHNRHPWQGGSCY